MGGSNVPIFCCSIIEFNFEKLKKSQLISNYQNDSKFNISTTLGLKIMKIASKKSHLSRALQKYQELPSFLCWMFWQNCSIFNNSCTTIGLNTTKITLVHHYSSKAFEQYWEHEKGKGSASWMNWEISTQQTKQTNYLL
jgi:hypothetical protein